LSHGYYAFRKTGRNSEHPKNYRRHEKIYASLLLTCKNVSLYPEGHSIGINSIKQFHETLENYIRQYGDLKIEIERDRIVCQGIEVQRGTSEEGSLPFTLFRDGIRWIEFIEGIEPNETKEVLSIIRKYSTLSVEPEGDIVTSFWEAHFNHVLYEADDFVSEQVLEEMENFTRSEDKSPSEIDQKSQMIEKKAPPDDEEQTILKPTINPDEFVLTPQEKTELQEMISREASMSATEHLSMLMDLLLQFQRESDFQVVFEVLAEEFDNSYRQHDFEAAVYILEGIQRVLKSHKLRGPAAQILVESFYQTLSSDARCVKPLEEIWSNMNTQQMDKIKKYSCI